MSTSNQKTPLHYIAKIPVHNSHEELKILQKMADRGVDVNKRTKKQGYTAVHIAVLANNPDMINLLYFIRADLELRCFDGFSPVQVGYLIQTNEVIDALLQLGVNNEPYVPSNQDQLVQSEIESHSEPFGQPGKKSEILEVHSAPMTVPVVHVSLRSDHKIHSMIARRLKTTEIAKIVKKEGIEILNIPDAQGKFPIHIAVQLKFMEIVILLVERYQVPLNEKDGQENTILHIAAKNGDLKMCEYLLSRGTDGRIRNGEGNTLVHIFSKIIIDQQNLTVLQKTMKLLNDSQMDFSEYNIHGYTALHLCSQFGNCPMISLILEYTLPDINKLSVYPNENQTALQIACYNNQRSAVRLLRSKGASISCFSDAEFNKLPLELRNILLIIEPNTSAFDQVTNQFYSLICIGNKPEIKKLIKKYPKLITSADKQGFNAVHLATCINNSDLLQFLLSYNIDPNIYNEKGFTPLLTAAKSGFLNVKISFYSNFF